MNQRRTPWGLLAAPMTWLVVVYLGALGFIFATGGIGSLLGAAFSTRATARFGAGPALIGSLVLLGGEPGDDLQLAVPQAGGDLQPGQLRVTRHPACDESTRDDSHASSRGHARVDHATSYPVTAEGVMQIYTPSRTGLVFANKD